jgi:hypothetical protein
LELERLEDRSLLSSSALTSTAAAAYGQLPLAFEVNQGQAAAGVNYLAHGNGYTLALTPQQAMLALNGQGTTTNVLGLQLVGANPSAQAVATDPLITKSNYLIGNDSSKWLTGIANYGQVEYQNVYNGINLDYHGNQGQLEYDFVVNPGASASAITLGVQGAESLSLDAQGNLVLHTSGGDVVEQAPVLYQQVNGTRQSVSGSFVLEGDNKVGFQVGAYDPTKALVIDPVLSYSTYADGYGYGIAVDGAGDAYLTGPGPHVEELNPTGTAVLYDTTLGGGGWGEGIAVDSSGDAYVEGYTTSSSLPTTANALAPTGSSGNFLAVLNPTGSGLIYSTYLPGTIRSAPVNSYHWGGVAVDASGDAYLTAAAGPGLITTAGAYQATFGASGGQQPFFAEINPALSGSVSLVYASYLGGAGASNRDAGTGIAVDSSGNAYLAGVTYSSSFATTAGAYQTTYGGGGSTWVAKFNPNLSGSASLVYATFLGSSDAYTSDNPAGLVDITQKAGPGIAVDSAGDAYVAGVTTSSNFPTTSGAFQRTYHAGTKKTSNPADAFVTKLNPTGTALVYSTYLGGSYLDGASAIAVDASGDAHVTGWTRSTDFPTQNPIQAQIVPGNDGGGHQNSDNFVTILNSSGSGLVFSTYLGGNADDYAYAIALDSAGNTYVTGQTQSSNYPTTAGAAFTSGSGFVSKISSPGMGPVHLSPATGTAPANAGATSPQSPAITNGIAHPVATLQPSLGTSLAVVPLSAGQSQGSLATPPAVTDRAAPGGVIDQVFTAFDPMMVFNPRGKDRALTAVWEG